MEGQWGFPAKEWGCVSGAGDPWMESGGEVALVAVSRSTALAAFLLKAGGVVIIPKGGDEEFEWIQRVRGSLQTELPGFLLQSGCVHPARISVEA